MHMLYDTRTVHPLDRYDYYRPAIQGLAIPPWLPPSVCSASPRRSAKASTGCTGT